MTSLGQVPRIFISYKSQDANLSRATAERLTAQGFNVWFAEYRVRPDNYEAFEADLRSNLEQAVASCTHALLFVNERWARSAYCQMEMDAARKHLPSECLIAIRRQDDQRSSLPSSVSKEIVYRDDLGELLAQICDRIGERLPTPRPFYYLGPEMAYLPHLGIRFQRGAFVDNPGYGKPNDDALRMTSQLTLEGRMLGRTVHLLLRVSPFQTVLGPNRLPDSVSGHDRVDDRELYNQYRQYAKVWAAEQKLRFQGLHLLFFNPNDRDAVDTTLERLASPPATSQPKSHFSVSYISQGRNSGREYWERLYSIPIYDGDRIAGEAVLVFYCELDGSYDTQFRQFCEFCQHFDEIVLSFRFIPATAKQLMIEILPIALVKLNLTALAYLIAANLPRLPIGLCLPVSEAIAWSLTGWSLIDILLFLISPTYQRAMRQFRIRLEDTWKNPRRRFMFNLFVWYEQLYRPLLLPLGATRGGSLLLLLGTMILVALDILPNVELAGVITGVLMGLVGGIALIARINRGTQPTSSDQGDARQ